VKSGVDQVMVKPVSAQAVLELARHLLEAPTAQARSDSYHGPDRRRVAPPHYDGPNRRED
jgi:hypothetical protein